MFFETGNTDFASYADSDTPYTHSDITKDLENLQETLKISFASCLLVPNAGIVNTKRSGRFPN